MRFLLAFAVLLLLDSMVAVYGAPGKSTKVPRFDAAVEKALSWLTNEVRAKESHGGEQILAAYAMFKCGVPPEDPFIAGAIAAAAGRSRPPEYRPVSAYDHIYGAGVDSMLLSDVDADQYRENLQAIANYVQAVQRADGSWSDGPQKPGDVSMSQYGILALWACQRAGCNVSAAALDRAAGFLMNRGNPDGGWGYRPGTTEGPGMGASTHNMTMAGAGSLAVARLLLHGPKNPATEEKKEELVLGALQKVDPLAESSASGPAFKDYRPQHAVGSLDARIGRAFDWNLSRFTAVSRVEHNLYFYYCIERAAAISDLGKINGQDWFTVYGDGLLVLQAQDGSFATHTGPVVGTSFALLYFMRSTQQILDKQYGLGLQHGKRGNPFGGKEKEREPTELDLLIADIEKIDFEKLDETPPEIADEIVRSVTAIDNPEELVGQEEKLISLMKHPSADVRKASCWALGRTGDFKLIPLMLDGIRDPNLDVNVEAVAALRYIARKPGGFGESLNPMEGLEKATEEQRIRAANEWRQKVLKLWSSWYFTVRPHEEQDGLDQLLLAVPLSSASPENPGAEK